MFTEECSVSTSRKGSLLLSQPALWQTSTPAMFSKDSIMAFLRHQATRCMEEALANFVEAKISTYLHERFETFLGDHWVSRWFFTTTVKFLIKSTLMVMLRGLATAVHKCLRNVLSTIGKKIFPEVTIVVVV